MVSFRDHAFVKGLEQHAMFSSVTQQISLFKLASQREDELFLSSVSTELVLADNKSTPVAQILFRTYWLHCAEIGMHPRSGQSQIMSYDVTR